MNHRLLYRLCLGALLLLPVARADTWTVDLLPSADLSAFPGQTVEWQYSITNNSASLWLVLDNVSADVFSNGTPDSSVFDYPIIGPGGTLTGPLFDFTWDPGAPPGFVNSGTFVLNAEWWNGDPINDPEATFNSLADDGSAPYSVTVEAVPEPATATLVTLPLLFMGWMFWRRSRLGRAKS